MRRKHGCVHETVQQCFADMRGAAQRVRWQGPVGAGARGQARQNAGTDGGDGHARVSTEGLRTEVTPAVHATANVRCDTLYTSSGASMQSCV